MAQVRFPQYLSRPPKVLWWDMDVFLIFAVLFVLAMLLGFESLTGFIIGGVLAVLAPYTYDHIKKKYPRGFLKYLMYILGLMKLDGYPDAFIQRFEE